MIRDKTSMQQALREHHLMWRRPFVMFRAFRRMQKGCKAGNPQKGRRA